MAIHSLKGILMSSNYVSLLHQMVSITKTDFWNDSCASQELQNALVQGAVGATSNPVIVTNVLKSEFADWQGRLKEIINQNPEYSEFEIGWKIYEEITVHGAKLLLPVFEKYHGLKGRLSIQVDPALYNNATAMLVQAEHFFKLAPNVQIKFPVTPAGLVAMEEATYRGIPITGTVCFTVAQSIAVAEAVERGLNRRQVEGKPSGSYVPVCAFMVGRTDDWMRVLSQRDQIDIPQEYLDWAGIACLKKSYGIFQQRGYRTRLLVAAYRSVLHWSEFIGGDLAMTITTEWQHKINASGVEVRTRIQDPVKPEILDALMTRIPDFRRAYSETELPIEAFTQYGATLRTLRSFIQSTHDLTALVRDVMLPNVDQKPV
jgi:transaldolase